MSFAGFKKQLNKANQLLSEKMAGTRGTELDSEYMEMEKKIDAAIKMVDELIIRMQEYLQPNPMARARLTAVRSLNSLQSKANRSAAYPQPEGIMGESMIRHGNELGTESALGSALVDLGEAYKQMAEIKYSLEDSVKQNFLEPFASLQQRDFREISHHRKKLEGRRLDYDCKKRRGSGRNPEEELSVAEEKFVESKNLAESAMVNFLNSDTEHVSALCELASAEIAYHQEAVRIFTDLQSQLEERRSEAASRPKLEHVPKRAVSAAGDSSSAGDSSEGAFGYDLNQGVENAPTVCARPRREESKPATPTCRALYNFVAESSTELAFDEGDVIQLIEQVDDNWYEGQLRGNRGYFPVNYVEVIVPLP